MLGLASKISDFNVRRSILSPSRSKPSNRWILGAELPFCRAQAFKGLLVYLLDVGESTHEIFEVAAIKFMKLLRAQHDFYYR